jgi:hypothetical protein
LQLVVAADGCGYLSDRRVLFVGYISSEKDTYKCRRLLGDFYEVKRVGGLIIAVAAS